MPVGPSGSGSHVRVVSGSFAGVAGPGESHSPLSILDVVLLGDAMVDVPVLRGHRGFLVALTGSGTVSGTQLRADDVAWLSDGADKDVDAVLRLAGGGASAPAAAAARVDATPRDAPAVLEGATAASSAAPWRVLIFVGLPHGDPVAARGPFVMTTQRELAQAVADYRAGLF